MLTDLLDAATTVTQPRTARLRLDRPVAGDLDALWRIHSDPETNLHNPAGPMSDPVDATARLDDWVAHWHRYGFGYWSVREIGQADAHGPVIGFCGIRWSTWLRRDVLNLYYRFSPSVWGRGYAAEAAAAGAALWRSHLSADPLIAFTTRSNVGSQRTALSAGLPRRPDLDVIADNVHDIVFCLNW